MTLTKFRVGSVAKVFGDVYAGVGLIIGLCVAVVSMLGSGLASAMGGESGASSVIGSLFGVGAIVFLPILYGVLGFVGGALMSALYNMAAGLVGGIEIETR